MNFIFFLVFMLLCINSVDAEESKIKFDPNKDIVLGQSAFLSGANQLYGKLIRNAINSRFKRANEQKEIEGKTIQLMSLDDRGEPDLTAKNIKKMREYNIDMFLGNMGTRGVFKVLPQIKNKEIAMLFPWGGSEQLRQSNLTNLVNGLGLISPQITALVQYALTNLRLKKIALFYDDSTFGKENVQKTIVELKKYNVEPIATESYNRFTMDIKTPAFKLIQADPKLVICLCTSMPAVKLVNYFFEEGHYGTKFIGIDSTMFADTILEWKGGDLPFASPVPNPKKSKLQIAKQFRTDIKRYAPQDPINILSFSYYIHASIVIEALKKITGPINKEAVLREIEKMKNYDLGGFVVDFDPQTRHAYKHIISIVKG